jgi:hypothetical protein
MKWLTILGGLMLMTPSAGAAIEPLNVPSAKGLTVHEWGVFRVNEDVDFANADLRAEWDDLPPFVYGHIKGRVVPQHWGAYEIRRRPIIFFHAKQPALVRLRVAFPGGQAGVWWPATEIPAVDRSQKEPKFGNFLEWNLAIKESPSNWLSKNTAPKVVLGKHWMERLREVKSDAVFARFGPRNDDVESERFLYYDGIFPQGKWLAFDVTKDRMALTSRVKHPVFDVTVVDRRGEKVRIGRIDKIEPNETIKEIKFAEVDASRFASEAAETLLKQLIGAGLFDDEARSLVDLWKKELFETPGINAFYRIPQAEYDARLPLTITPKPDSVVRVGLVYQAHLEPDFSERILELVKLLDSDTFAQRDAAMKKLLAIGPAALVQLKRLQATKGLSVEVRERIDVLVRKWAAKDAFEAPTEPK